MQEQLQEKEAGVAELLDFYARVETVYISASQALEESHTIKASNSTNSG